MTQRVPSSARPHTTSGTTSSVVGSGTVGERAEGHRAGAGDADLVVALDAGQHGVGLGQRDAGRHATPGQTRAAALEQHAVPAGQREQVEVVVDAPGAWRRARSRGGRSGAGDQLGDADRQEPAVDVRRTRPPRSCSSIAVGSGR